MSLVDLPVVGRWESLCDAYRAGLVIDGKPAEATLHIQIYQGYPHALSEIAQSLASVFTTKKTIALAHGAEIAFEEIAKTLSSQEFKVRRLSSDDLANPAAWLAEIESDLLFVLVSEDDAVTGARRDLSGLTATLKDKRVFRIVLSHASWRADGIARPGIYEVRVLSLSADRALMVAGERGRVQPRLAPQLAWSAESAETIAELLRTSNASASEAKIAAFESSLPEGFRAFFAKGASRVFDRAVIFNPEFDGSAVIHELAKERASLDTRGFETTSACEWESPRLAEWLSRNGFSDEQVRSLVAISIDHIGPALTNQLALVAQRLRKIQNG